MLSPIILVIRKALAASIQHRYFYKVLSAFIKVSLYSSKRLQRVAQEASATVAFAISDPETWRLGGLARRLSDAGIKTVGVKVRYLASSSSKQTAITDAVMEVQNFRWASLRDIIFLHYVGMLFLSQPYLASGLLGSERSPHSKKIYVPYTFGIVANGAETSFGSFVLSKVDLVLVPLVSMQGKYKEALGVEELAVGFPGVSEIAWNDKSAIETTEIKILWAPHWTLSLGGDTRVLFEWLEALCSLRSEINATGRSCQVMLRAHPRLLANLSTKQQDSFMNIVNSRDLLVSKGQGIAADFNWSSLLVHNSGSFTIEYLLTGKPSIFLSVDSDVIPNLTPLGQEALGMNLVVDSVESLRLAVLQIVDSRNTTMDQRLRYGLALREACEDFEDLVESLARRTLRTES